MSDDQRPLRHLLWVYPGSLTEALDSATWLETTRELRQQGWQVTLIAVGPAGIQVIGGVEVLGVPKPDLYLVRQLVYHVGVLRQVATSWPGLDLILFHQMSAPWLLPLRLMRRLTGKQQPLLVMDTRTLFMYLSTRKDRLRAWFYRAVHRLANRWADGQTAITWRMAEAVGIPSEKLWGVWPSGVNLDRFAPAQTARQWPLAGEPIRLVYAGALYRERNLLPLCQAVERANALGMAYVFSLVGDGPERSTLEEFAAETDGRVQVLPRVPHEEIPGLLAQMHVGVLPFTDEVKFQVSSPIKLFEYLAAGLPILATRIACHTDVMEGGTYVLWAEDGSVEGLLMALRLAWEARASLGRMGHEAAAVAEGWTWHEAARKLGACLEIGLGRQPSL